MPSRIFFIDGTHLSTLAIRVGPFVSGDCGPRMVGRRSRAEVISTSFCASTVQGACACTVGCLAVVASWVVGWGEAFGDFGGWNKVAVFRLDENSGLEEGGDVHAVGLGKAVWAMGFLRLGRGGVARAGVTRRWVPGRGGVCGRLVRRRRGGRRGPDGHASGVPEHGHPCGREGCVECVGGVVERVGDQPRASARATTGVSLPSAVRSAPSARLVSSRRSRGLSWVGRCAVKRWPTGTLR